MATTVSSSHNSNTGLWVGLTVVLLLILGAIWYVSATENSGYDTSNMAYSTTNDPVDEFQGTNAPMNATTEGVNGSTDNRDTLGASSDDTSIR